jgi:hypothetical protein
MKTFEIWVGYYHLGQGSHGTTSSRKVGTIEAIDFKTACIKYELKNKMDRILEGEKDKDLNSQDYPWWFNADKISNSWTGRYFETEEEADQTFVGKLERL